MRCELNRFSDIATPLQVETVDDVSWHHTADVLVVGVGAAGVCAALQASEQGAEVIAIDRFEGGGDTALSGGVLYAGGGTRFQKEVGFTDDPENMQAYLTQEVQAVVSNKTLKRFCQQSVENIQWLEKNGVTFKASLSPVKTSYPSKAHYLYYSGNETVADYAQQSRPVPRGHRAVGKGLSGRALFKPLQLSAQEKGVTFLYQSKAVRLIIDQQGELVGLEVSRVAPFLRAKHRRLQRAVNAARAWAPSLARRLRKQVIAIESQYAQIIYLRAKKGIVLSCGGFAFNRQMLTHHAPKYLKTMALGTTGADGSGIHLAQTVNAATDKMDNISAWRFINPPQAWVKGMLVNAQGQRFVNEQCYGATIGSAMCENQSGVAYLILSRALLWQAFKQVLPWKIWLFQAIPACFAMLCAVKKAANISGLAEQLGMSEKILQTTLEQYNAAANGRQADSFGKAEEFMQVLDQGPFYALNMSATNKFFPLPMITLGGVCVDESTGLVKDAAGKTIPKLYAAGRTAIGVASNMYVSGLSIADCVFSGRRAGQHAAGAVK